MWLTVRTACCCCCCCLCCCQGLSVPTHRLVSVTGGCRRLLAAHVHHPAYAVAANTTVVQIMRWLGVCFTLCMLEACYNQAVLPGLCS
jgi:hypothetical protein